LVKVLGDLETGSVSLEESMTLWERGEALAKHCKALLAGAKTKIDEALKDK
jgi:exodeoxyribonuclease VII small subunit